MGSDRIDLQTIDNKVDVVEVTFCNSRSIAEHIVMMIVSMVRDYHNQRRLLLKLVGILRCRSKILRCQGMHVGTVAAGRIGLDAKNEAMTLICIVLTDTDCLKILKELNLTL